MKRIGRFIARRKISIVLIAFLLLIPSAIGFIATKVNYDILSYLPDSLETVAGQDIMVDEFGMGAFSMVVVDGMAKKDVVALEEKIEAIDHVEKVLWYDDFAGIDVPVSMIPGAVADALFQGDSTMMIALFDQTTSAETTMEAIEEMRAEVGQQCFISGMSGIVTDIKNLAMKEIPGYVMVASLLSLLRRLPAGADSDHRFFCSTVYFSDQHRAGGSLQHGKQSVSGRRFLYYTGPGGGSSAGSHDGLFHLSSAQL